MFLPFASVRSGSRTAGLVRRNAGQRTLTALRWPYCGAATVAPGPEPEAGPIVVSIEFIL
jgi:hypothetical protein